MKNIVRGNNITWVILRTMVIMHFNTATPNSTNFASKLFYYVFFNL